MYNVMREHLSRGSYKLREAQDKIDKLWIMGSLTDEQRDELLDMARGNAQAANEVDVMAKMAELEGRIRALEQGEQDDQSGETAGGYPAYTPGKWYYAGDRVTHDGAAYECMAPSDQVCTWSPAEYPAYWRRID